MKIDGIPMTNGWLIAGAAILALITLILAVRKIRKVTRNTRADDLLANAVMVVGLGWSSEAMWEIARDKLELPLPLTILLFSVFEAALLLSTLRAKRSLRENGWPGRYGRTAWILAVAMGGVAAAAGDSFAEVVLRFTIPLVVTKLWWDGLVGETVKPEGQESSWTISPAKILVRLRLKKPGRESLETVNRQWLIERMTKLEFQLRFGNKRGRDKIRMKLARLAIDADPGVLDAVLVRVSLADTYLSSTVPARVPGAVPLTVPGVVPAVPQDTVPMSPAPLGTPVPAGQDAYTGPVTDEDLMHLVSSYSLQDDPDTGRPYGVRKIGQILGINKNKVSELRQIAEKRIKAEDAEPRVNGFDHATAQT